MHETWQPVKMSNPWSGPGLLGLALLVSLPLGSAAAQAKVPAKTVFTARQRGHCRYSSRTSSLQPAAAHDGIAWHSVSQGPRPLNSFVQRRR